MDKRQVYVWVTTPADDDGKVEVTLKSGKTIRITPCSVLLSEDVLPLTDGRVLDERYATT